MVTGDKLKKKIWSFSPWNCLRGYPDVSGSGSKTDISVLVSTQETLPEKQRAPENRCREKCPLFAPTLDRAVGALSLSAEFGCSFSRPCYIGAQ